MNRLESKTDAGEHSIASTKHHSGTNDLLPAQARDTGFIVLCFLLPCCSRSNWGRVALSLRRARTVTRKSKLHSNSDMDYSCS